MTKNYFKIKDISNFINRNYNIKFFSSKNEKDYKIICENLHNELSKIKMKLIIQQIGIGLKKLLIHMKEFTFQIMNLLLNINQ